MTAMKTRSKKSQEKSQTKKAQASKKSSEAYGDKATICANTGCALRKKAKCFGFEGCPGFKAK